MHVEYYFAKKEKNGTRGVNSVRTLRYKPKQRVFKRVLQKWGIECLKYIKFALKP